MDRPEPNLGMLNKDTKETSQMNFEKNPTSSLGGDAITRL